jgi:hypothetical protein
MLQTIKNFLFNNSNDSNRVAWLSAKLKQIPAGHRILMPVRGSSDLSRSVLIWITSHRTLVSTKEKVMVRDFSQELGMPNELT